MSATLQRPSPLASQSGVARAGLKIARLIATRSETVLRPSPFWSPHSQALPRPSPSVSAWSGLAKAGQSSQSLPRKSRSGSTLGESGARSTALVQPSSSRSMSPASQTASPSVSGPSSNGSNAPLVQSSQPSASTSAHRAAFRGDTSTSSSKPSSSSSSSQASTSRSPSAFGPVLLQGESVSV